MTYLPVDKKCMSIDAESRLCKLDPKVEGPLPNLIFYLSQNKSANRITIPIANLIEKNDKGERLIYILPDENKVEHRGYSIVPTIKIGYKGRSKFMLLDFNFFYSFGKLNRGYRFYQPHCGIRSEK